MASHAQGTGPALWRDQGNELLYTTLFPGQPFPSPVKARLALLFLLPGLLSLAAPVTQQPSLQPAKLSKANLYSNEQEIVDSSCCCG